MSYIITAEVFTDVEENRSGDISKVDARILSKKERGSTITFDIPGDFFKRQELTKKLCDTLINAGFVSFTIGHSY